MLKILSFDPGITTGYSLAILDSNVLYVSCDQAKFSHRNLWNFLLDIEPNHIICESFEYRNDSHRDNLELYSLELIGVIKLYRMSVVMQTAAKGKGHYSDAKLQKMGLYIPGLGHGRDAMRHLLQWWTFGPGFQYNTKDTKIMLAQFETVLSKV